MQARAAAFGAGLVALGCKPQPAGVDYENLNGPHTILLWEDTCADWLTALIGAGGQSVAVATSYATLGIDAVSEALKTKTMVQLATMLQTPGGELGEGVAKAEALQEPVVDLSGWDLADVDPPLPVLPPLPLVT